MRRSRSRCLRETGIISRTVAIGYGSCGTRRDGEVGACRGDGGDGRRGLERRGVVRFLFLQEVTEILGHGRCAAIWREKTWAGRPCYVARASCPWILLRVLL